MSTPNSDDAARSPADRLEASWEANAEAWSAVVRDERIESRRIATNTAVLCAVQAAGPQRVLDVGCGEGWLCRALAEHGIEAVGVDVSASLVRAARKQGEGTFHTCSYEALAAGPTQVGRDFDVIVCNFSLLEEDLHPLLTALHAICAPEGRLVIQTVHPWSARGDAPYADGWRVEDFGDFDAPFAEPMPWYYRTLSSWIGELRAADWLVRAAAEPTHPDSGDPLSLLLTCMTCSAPD